MPPIVFGILAHDTPQLVAKNIATYYRHDCLYVIHVDRKRLDDWTRAMPYLPSNVRIISQNFVSWASIGILDATIDLIDEALKIPGWRRFCLLSGQDVAVRPSDSLLQDLLDKPSRIAQWNVVSDWENDLLASEESLGWGAASKLGECPQVFSSHFRSASVHPDLRVTNANHLGRWRFGYDYTVDTLADSLSIKPHSVMGREKIDAGSVRVKKSR